MAGILTLIGIVLTIVSAFMYSDTLGVFVMGLWFILIPAGYELDKRRNY